MADVGRELNELVALPMSTRVQSKRYWAWTLLVKTVDRRSALSCVIQVAASSMSPSNSVTSASTLLPCAHNILKYIALPIH